MFERPVQRLIDQLTRLPGIGRKSAQRLTFYLLNIDKADALALAQAIIDLREQTSACRQCNNVTSDMKCSICQDPRRDNTTVCVVERAQDIAVIERTREFNGLYHVLGGVLSPIDGIQPAQLRIRHLRDRVLASNDRLADQSSTEEPANENGAEHVPMITELIIATNPTIEGDTTASYLARMFQPMGVTVTRLASGLPVGGDIDYADEITLGRALMGRREI